MVVQNFETNADMIKMAESVMQKKCVIFIGAGVSMASGFPDWSDLMQKMRDRKSVV